MTKLLDVDTLLHAVQAPRRREILQLLRAGERAAGEIHRALAGVTFGAVSQHLGVLEQAGLVSGRREGRSRLYALRQEGLLPLRAWLDAMWGDALSRLSDMAAAEEGGGRPARGHPRRSRRPAARVPGRAGKGRGEKRGAR